MSGTWGTVWAEGKEIAEISGFQCKVVKNWDPINICGQMAEDRKLVSIKITGSMNLHKVYSRGAEDVNAAELDDPDAYGAERIAVYGMNYDEQTLMDFAAGKAGSVTVPFQATRYEYLDQIEPPQ